MSTVVSLYKDHSKNKQDVDLVGYTVLLQFQVESRDGKFIIRLVDHGPTQQLAQCVLLLLMHRHTSRVSVYSQYLPSPAGGKRGSIAPSNSWLATMLLMEQVEGSLQQLVLQEYYQQVYGHGLTGQELRQDLQGIVQVTFFIVCN